ncbi:MAG: transporter substrate-binding domain-containing protein [Lachnospiraceae bacterium]|jgi:polar amino acid transport system substrate-binding protein|nr:transporter substrate-binding domain-containing protein [Lachnospiraceae bacterium]
MKKRTIATLAALCAAATLFAGCGSTAATTTTAAPAPAAETTAAASTDWDYISGKGEMIIGITYYAPMNYLDDDKNLVGFDTELAEAVCAKLGVKPVFQEIEWGSKETELAAKNIDAVWNGMTATAERAQNMNLSQSYLKNAPVVIVRAADVEKYKTADDLKGASVVAENGSMAAELIESDDFFAQGSHTLVDTQVKTFLELKAGTADVVIGDYVAAIGSIGEGTDFADLVVSPYKTFEGETYAIAFRKGDDSVTSRVNAILDELTQDGTVETIAKKYKLESQIITK